MEKCPKGGSYRHWIKEAGRFARIEVNPFETTQDHNWMDDAAHSMMSAEIRA
jgi:hypothetical protein